MGTMLICAYILFVNLTMVQTHQNLTDTLTVVTTRNRRRSKIKTGYQLGEEFRRILNSNTISPFQTQYYCLTQTFSYTDTLSNSHEVSTINGINVSERINWESHGVPKYAIQNLRQTAKRMISAAYSQECVCVYSEVRKQAMATSCNVLGLEELVYQDTQRMTWESRKVLIKDWTRLAKVCIRFLFAGERRLCEQIFDDLDGVSITEACFMNTVEDSVVLLLNFAKRISMDRPSIIKLFTLLDAYNVLSDLLPDIKIVFGSICGESIRIQANEILRDIANIAVGSYSEFQDGLIDEVSQFVDNPGVVHGLTRYVMKYVTDMMKFSKSLEELLVSKPLAYSNGTVLLDVDVLEFSLKANTLGLHVIWILEILVHKLKQKSIGYKDASMANLFMMKNMNYIIGKIEQSSKLWKIIGYEYSGRLMEKYQLCILNYQKSTWGRMLHCLIEDGGLKCFLSVFFKCVVRRRLKHFNCLFDNILTTHSEPATKLPKELKIVVLKKIIPAYKSFLDKYRCRIGGGKYVKYSEEELQKAIEQLLKN